MPAPLSFRLCVAVTISITAVCSPRVQAIDITVSPDGQIKSLTEARDALRKARQTEPDETYTILVTPGRYLQAEPLILEAQDSLLTIRAAAGERPWLIGAPVVSGWQVHQGEILKAHIANLLPKGFAPRQLLCNGKRQPLARYPNFDPQNPLYGGWNFIPPYEPEKTPAESYSKRETWLKAEDIRSWKHPEQVEINIFAGPGYWNFFEPIQSLDPVTRKLTLQKDCGYELKPDNRYYFQNALEELDAPGEWFYDRDSGDLYFWPPGKIADLEIHIPLLESFVQINGARDITLSGLGFTACTDTAIRIQDSDGIRIERCHVSQCGGVNGSGISIIKGSKCLVSRCEIEGTGYHGVSLVGGDPKTLTGPGHIVENCHIHEIGAIKKNGAGISMNGVNLIAQHNHIHHVPRIAVQMAGNHCKVDWNHIHHTMLETQDGGSIYTGGRNWIDSRGTSWSYNLVHDTMGCMQEGGKLTIPMYSFGLYPDDNAGGLDIIGNIVYNSASSGIHLHNARDCVIENNIFGRSDKWTIDLHGWTKDMRYWTNHSQNMIEGYESVAGLPAWRNMRNMDLHPKDAFHPDGTMMSGNIIRRNILFASAPDVVMTSLRYCSSQWNTIDENLVWNSAGPVRTGYRHVGKDTKPVRLAGASNFRKEKPGTHPAGWGWAQAPPKAEIVVNRERNLVVDSAPTGNAKNPYATFRGPDFPIRPGAAYRARAKIRGTQANMAIRFAIAAYKGGVGYWQDKFANYTLGTDWQEIETVATLPAPGDNKYQSWIENCWTYFSSESATGQIEIAELTVHEAEPMDEWRSWQQEGWDQHSIVADPLFVDPEKGDYRLQNNSPALKIGFQPTPINQIGIQPE